MGDTIRPPWIFEYGICSSIISFGVLQDFGIMPGSLSAALIKLIGQNLLRYGYYSHDLKREAEYTNPALSNLVSI
jgi:hypothetical protein